MTNNENKKVKLNNYEQVSKPVMIVIGLISLFYITWWFNLGNAGNPYLYGLLLIGEVFHVFQAISYVYTVYDLKKPVFQKVINYYPVDIFITVCGEPVEIVEQTVKAALNINYLNFNVYILNDGLVAKKDNWREIEQLQEKYPIRVITRTIPGGFKAGNINNALNSTTAPFIAIFDADHIPDPDFLLRTMGYFKDPKLALVQTPQYYMNKFDNELTKAAWEQQEIFFGPISVGKNRSNAAFWCGTNAVVRRQAIVDIGGVPTNNIAEDFLASLFMHSKGWNSLYVPEILAKGMAPFNLKDYVKQQFRWARGSLEIIFKYNPIFKKGLTWRQKLQYLSSSSYYLTGLIILIDALIPVLALGFEATPVKVNTGDFIIYFIPFLVSTIYLLTVTNKNQITFNALQLSTGSFYVFFVAMISTIFGLKVSFDVTPKSNESGNYLKFVIPHLLYVLIGFWAIITGVRREGFNPSIINNTSWVIFNIVMFSGFVKLAYPWNKIWDYINTPFTERESVNTISYAYNYNENKKEENSERI